jgi:hypothetical protein
LSSPYISQCCIGNAFLHRIYSVGSLWIRYLVILKLGMLLGSRKSPIFILCGYIVRMWSIYIKWISELGTAPNTPKFAWTMRMKIDY